MRRRSVQQFARTVFSERRNNDAEEQANVRSRNTLRTS
jgi:hypothetical protein